MLHALTLDVGCTVFQANTHALHALKRVRARLEGPEGKELDDQVLSVIGDAVDTGNLARMYEGWTPWF